MNNADYLAQFLHKRGIKHVFELVGGMITVLLDALHRRGGTEIISMHHEQGAAFAAEGWARIRGLPGVALATSGPGATNLITGIGSCYFDSVPAVFITGQVNRYEMKGSRPIRQQGFQETNIVDMVSPITKKAWIVHEPSSFPEILEEAFKLAASGRPGPVLIDIPMDVQRAACDISKDNGFPPVEQSIVCPDFEKERQEFIDELIGAIGNSKRPLILAGGGIRSARAHSSFKQCVRQLRLPVVHSLMGVDLLPHDHPLRVGLIGSYGNRWANLALGESDFLLVLGSRLDIRQTGADVDGFKAQRKIYHVDCESGEMNNRVTGCQVWNEDLNPFLIALKNATDTGLAVRQDWNEKIASHRQEWPDSKELAGVSGINPNVFIHALSAHCRSAKTFIADVGQHQMWAAQSLRLSEGQRFLTSGGMGSMGFGLPAAIGAAKAAGLSVLIAGDGGFQCNLQELQTVVRNKLPLKMVVINNGCHGMVRQFQDSYFAGRLQSSVWGYDAPNFKRVAESYEISSARIETSQEINDGLAKMMDNPEQPYLLEVIVEQSANAYPKMAFGREFGAMEPNVDPLEMEGT